VRTHAYRHYTVAGRVYILPAEARRTEFFYDRKRRKIVVRLLSRDIDEM